MWSLARNPQSNRLSISTNRSGDGDYSVKEMEEKLNVTDVIRRLYNSVVKYAYGKKGIVYAINIDHAKAIAEYYNALGIKAVALDSKTAAKTRKKAVEAFSGRRVGLLGECEPF